MTERNKRRTRHKSDIYNIHFLDYISDKFHTFECRRDATIGYNFASSASRGLDGCCAREVRYHNVFEDESSKPGGHEDAPAFHHSRERLYRSLVASSEPVVGSG